MRDAERVQQLSRTGLHVAYRRGLGILIGSFLFLLPFYRYEAEQSWPRTITYTLGMWLFLVIVFQVILNANLYTGFFEVQLPLPF